MEKVGRWNENDTEAVAQMRKELQAEFLRVDPNVEVIGDRCLLRFFHAHGNDVSTACRYYRSFLSWRIEEGIDRIRQAIIFGPCNSARQFPHGDQILKYMPQTVCDTGMLTKSGMPVSFLSCDFSIDDVTEHVTIEQYTEFIKYLLEYSALVLEQLAEVEERACIEKMNIEISDGSQRSPYGVIKHMLVIRDLYHLNFGHIGPKSKELRDILIKLSSQYYPELFDKMVLCNAPWMFHSFYWVLKSVLPARILAKHCILGANLTELFEIIPQESLPQCLGGQYDIANSASTWQFDTDMESGLLSLPSSLRRASDILPTPACDDDIALYDSGVEQAKYSTGTGIETKV